MEFKATDGPPLVKWPTRLRESTDAAKDTEPYRPVLVIIIKTSAIVANVLEKLVVFQVNSFSPIGSH